MSKKRYKNVFRNIGVNFFGQFAGSLIQFFSVPIYLKHWGIDLYGEWLILSTLPAYLSISDIGFANAAANKMTMLVARRKNEEALKVFQSVFLLINILCISIFFIVTFLTYLLPLETWLNLENQSHYDVSIILTLMSLYVLSSLQGNFLMSGFRCNGKYAEGNLILIITRISECCCVLISVIYGANMILASAIFLIIRSLGLLALFFTLKVYSPWLRVGIKHSSVAEVKELFKPAVTFMAIPLGNALNNQGFLMSIAFYLNPVSVAIFSTMRTLSRFIFQLVNGISNGVWPELSAAYGGKDLKTARSMHRKVVQSSVWMSICTSIALFLFSRQIIDIWTGGRITYDTNLFIGFLLIVVVNSFWFSSSIALISTNNHSKMSIYYLIATTCSIGISCFLIQWIGLYGVILCMLFSELFMSQYIVRKSLRLLEDSYQSFFRALFSMTKLRF